MIGIVFDGGGVKGSYQAGAYLALKKCGVKPNIITGTSIGAFNGAMCVSHKEKELKDIWLNINFANVFGLKEADYYKVVDNNFASKLDGQYKLIKSFIKNKGIDTFGLKEVLEKNIDEVKVRNSDINFGLATLNLSKMEPKDLYINQMQEGKLNEYILASAYLPVFKGEKIIDNSNYADGGFYNACPVNMCIDAGCDLIYVIRIKGIGYSKRIKKNNSKIIYIQSSKSLGSILFTNHERSKYNMNLGYFDTLRIMRKLDGDKYYIKNRPDRTYELLIRNVDKKLLKKVQRKFNIFNNKKLIIKSLEYIMDVEKYNQFKEYGPILVILLTKKTTNNDIVYNFVRQLSVI